ncbi:MAG: hypothetical protein IKZ41_10325, partial [Clostridia bacterium]|nr:hypothetical protein [Clostridia bacterium]
MKKRAVCLCLCALLLTGAVCGCRYRGDARAEIENELDSARAENEAKRKDEAAEMNAAQETPIAAEQNPASDGAETDNPAPVEAGEPEETQTIKPAYKNDWDGIISSQYTVIGDRYYYHVKAKKTLTDKDGRTHTTGV